MKVGSRIYFEIEGGSFSGTFPTRIEDIDESKGFLAVAHPLYKGVLVPIRGERYYIWITTVRGIYRYPVEILGAKEDKVSLLLLKIIGGGEHLQRRRFVRMPINLPFTYRLKGKVGPPKKGYTKDLSAGGIKAVFEEPLLVGQRVLVRIDLEDDLGPMIVEGRIVRVDAREGVIEHGVEFLNLSERAIRRIMRFIFKKERELREKGLI